MAWPYDDPMRVLIAFDKFKDSMSAVEACAVAAGVIRRYRPKWEVDICPLSDGSDGFASILTQSRNGELVYTNVMGPNFRQTEAHFGLVDCANFSLSSKAWLKLPDRGTVAIVEMAQASGLYRLSNEERNLWHTSSFGTGELLRAALTFNPAVVILGLGGSATHDLGLGALEALGIRFRSESGDLITQMTPMQWPRVVAIEGEVEFKKLPRIILAPNVQNKLLGSRGAAALFGPQKGLKKSDLNRLEDETYRMSDLILSHFNAPRTLLEQTGSGASGGMSVGLRAAMKVEMIPGIELADRWLRLNERLERANLIITGEGKFDSGSLEGKAAQYVIERAANKGKRIYCFCGQIVPDENGNHAAVVREAKMVRIAPAGVSIEQSMSRAIDYLSDSVRAALESLPG